MLTDSQVSCSGEWAFDLYQLSAYLVFVFCDLFMFTARIWCSSFQERFDVYKREKFSQV